jgi:tetratricopeptide (TPR) repeat protein
MKAAIVVGILALAASGAAAAPAGPSGNPGNRTNDCKGDPGAGTVTACTKAISYDEVERYDLAVADCNRMLALQLKGFGALHHRAQVCLRAGKMREALADLDRSVTLKPKFYAVYEDRALAYADIGQFDRALAEFDHAIALGDVKPTAFLQRAMVLQRLGRTELALKAYDREIARFPKDPLFLLMRAQTYLDWKNGPPDRLARALKDVDASLALKPSPGGYAMRANIEKAQGDKAAAAADFKKAQATDHAARDGEKP